MRSHLAFKGPVHTLFVGTHRTIFCFDSIPTPPALHFVGLVSHLIDSYEVYNVEPLRRPRQVRPLQSDPDDVCLSPLQNIGVLPTTDVGTDDFMSDDQQTLPLDNWNGLTPNESRVLGLFPPGDFDVLTKTLLRVLKSCRSHIRQFKTYWDLSAGKQLFKLTAGELPAKEVHQLKRMSFHVDAPDLTCLEDVLTDLGYVLLTRKRKTTLQFRQGGSDSRVKVIVRGTETLEDEGEAASLIRNILSAKSCFEALGIKRGATKSEVRHAYRRLSLMVHPDKTSAKGSEAAQTVLNLAKSALETENGAVEYPEGIANAFGVDTSNLISALKVLSVATETNRLGAVSICRPGGSDLRFVLRGVKEVGDAFDVSGTPRNRLLPLPSSASTRRCPTGKHRSNTGQYDCNQSIAAQRYVDSRQSICQMLDAAWATRDGSDMNFRQLKFPSDDCSLTVARHSEDVYWTKGNILLCRSTIRMEHMDDSPLPPEILVEEINAEHWDMSELSCVPPSFDDETAAQMLTEVYNEFDWILSTIQRYNEIKPRDPRSRQNVVQVADRSRNRLSALRRK